MNKQILTDDKMRELFGKNFSNILYFNFDAGRWNANKYQGKILLNQDIDSTAAYRMQDDLNKVKASQGREVVAVAIMLVGDKYRLSGKFVSDPVFDAKGRNVVGTVVNRDVKTGQIMPISNKWLMANNLKYNVNAVQYGAFMFCNAVKNNVDFCRALAKINGRQR